MPASAKPDSAGFPATRSVTGNRSRGDREPLIAIARAHHAQVIGYFFDVSTREAVTRIAGRTGREKVPNVAIFAAAKRLQPPAFTEGFDQLFIVNPRPDYMFTIREYDRPARESSAQP
jgi:hypothetical protein